jgi:hypothetical protein
MSHVRAYNNNNERIATGRWCRYTGSFFQVYPEKKTFKNEAEWRESYTLPGTTFKTEAETKAMYLKREADAILEKNFDILKKMKKTRMPRTDENIVWFWKRKNLESFRRSYRLNEQKKARLIEAEAQKFYVKYGVRFKDCRHLAWSYTCYNPTILADYKRLNDIIYPPAPAPSPVLSAAISLVVPPVATPWTAEDERRFLELQARRPTTN